MAIKEEFDMLPWWEWPDKFKQKNNKFLEEWKIKNNRVILEKKLIQWHLHQQWIQIKNFAKNKGVKLIGDLPFYVSRDSADVWSNKSLFSLSRNGDLVFQSGVHLIISLQQDNYGELQLTFGQIIKGQISLGGEKDFKGNLNLSTY